MHNPFSFFVNFFKRISSGIPCFLLFFSLAVIWLLLFTPTDGLWYDECFSLYHSQGSVDDIIKVSTWDANPPFYLFVIKTWMNWVGFSAFKLRLLSLLFASLTVSLYTIWIKKILGNTYAILLFSLLLFSEITVEYAHEARVYSFIFLLVFISSWLTIQFVKKPTFLLMLALPLVNVLIFFSHYIEGIVVFIQSLYIFLAFLSRDFEWKHRLKMAGMYAVSGLIFLFYLNKSRFLFESLASKGGNNIIRPPLLSDIPKVFYDMMNHNSILTTFVAVIVFTLLGFVLFKPALFPQKNKWIIYYFLALTIVSFFTIFLISFKAPMFSRRYLMFIIFPLLVLIVFFIKYVIENQGKVVALIGFPLFFLSTNQFDTSKDMQIKESVRYIQQEKNENSLIIVQSRDIVANFTLYYDYEIFRKYGLLEEQLTAYNIISVNDTNSIITRVNLNQYDKVLLMQVFENVADPNKTIVALLNRKLRFKCKKSDFRGVKIQVFEPYKKPDFSKSEKQDLQLLFYTNKISSDPAWLEHVARKANEENISLDEALKNEANWLIGEDKRNLKSR